MREARLVVAVLSFYVLLMPRWSNAASIPTEEIKKAALNGIGAFFKNRGINGLHRFGFANDAESDRAALGTAFQIHTIDPSKLLDETSQDLQSLITPTDQWQFMVSSGGKVKTLLTVDSVDGVLTPVSIGSSGLAQELNGVLVAWPESAGYQHRLIRVYQAKSNFIELSRDGKVIGIIPLSSLLISMSRGEKTAFSPTNIADSKEVLVGLRSIVKKSKLTGQ